MQECVWGVAYKIPADQVESVKSHLDYREKGGYTSVNVTFHPEDPSILPFDLTIYIATKENPEYLGPSAIDNIAHQIYHSVGPSGKNTEYLFKLVHAVTELMPHVKDSHLIELNQAVHKIQQTNGLS